MASKPSSPSAELDELVTCSICLENFKDPRALPCVHSFCKVCLERLVSSQGTITCPQCRMEFEVPNGNVSNFTTNFFINSLQEVVNLTSEVTIEGQAAVTPHCAQHQGRMCELYCEDCSTLICFHCIAIWGDCHKHSYTNVDEASKKIRQAVENFSNKGTLFLPIVKRQLELLGDMKARQVANVAEVHERIEETFERHVAVLRSRKEELLLRVASMTQYQKEDGFTVEIDRFQMEQAKIANAIEFCRKMLNIDNPAIFIHKYYEVKDKLFGMEFPELISHVDVDEIRFDGNHSLLEDVISSYGCIVSCNGERTGDEKPVKEKDERPKVVIKSSDLVPGTSTPARSVGSNDASPQPSTSACPKESIQNGSSGASTSKKNSQPVFWKMYQKNRADPLVSIEDKGLTVQSGSSKNVAIVGQPGFRSGRHSWKVEVQSSGAGLGVGVCMARDSPGVCIMFDAALTRFGSPAMVAVELDCDARHVRVKMDGGLEHSLGYQNQPQFVYPYFLLPNSDRSGKLTIVEMDGECPGGNTSSCSIL